MKPASERLGYLDWVRGLAAIIMLQGHVFHSFVKNDLRQGGRPQHAQHQVVRVPRFDIHVGAHPLLGVLVHRRCSATAAELAPYRTTRGRMP